MLADIPATGHHYVEGKCSVCGAIEATATVPDADNSQEGMDNTAASNKALPETSDSTLPLAVVALILGIGAITSSHLFQYENRIFFPECFRLADGFQSESGNLPA